MRADADKYLWPKNPNPKKPIPQVQIRRITNTLYREGQAAQKFGESWMVTLPAKFTGRRRERCQFTSEDKAREYAEKVCAEKRDLGESIFDLKKQERVEAMTTYATAKDLIPEGYTLLNVVTDASKAIKALSGRKVSLEAVAKFYVDRQPKHDKTVPDVVAEFVTLRAKRTKKGTPASAKYLSDLNRLEKFAADFPCAIAEVQPSQIDKWADDKKLKGRTRFNYLRMIRTLFKYGQAKEYFPRTVNPMEGIDGVDSYQDDGEIEIFTPAEMREILGVARPEIIPFLTIGAFAGLRSHSEIMRLDWSHILFERGFIEIKPRNTKTASRRLVPLVDNLKQWLAPYRKESGAVCSFANMGKQIAWLVDDINAARKEAHPEAKQFEWKHNALRHSFISYRLACVQNTAQVALEAGNSERMIVKHYREVVEPNAGGEWFGIVPAKDAGNIVPMAVGHE